MGKQTWQIVSQLFEGPEPRLHTVRSLNYRTLWKVGKGREENEAVGRGEGGCSERRLQSEAQHERGELGWPRASKHPPNEYTRNLLIPAAGSWMR